MTPVPLFPTPNRRADLRARVELASDHRRHPRRATRGRRSRSSSRIARTRRAFSAPRRRHRRRLPARAQLRRSRRLRSRAGRAPARARRRPGLPRRLHAADRRGRSSTRIRIASSTSIRRCCPHFPAWTRSARRSSTASASPAPPSTSSTATSTPGRSCCNRPCRCATKTRSRRCRRAFSIEEHRLYPDAIRRVLDGGWTVQGRRFVRAGRRTRVADWTEADSRRISRSRRSRCRGATRRCRRC